VNDHEFPEVKAAEFIPALKNPRAANRATHPIDPDAFVVVRRRVALKCEQGIGGVGMFAGHRPQHIVKRLAIPGSFDNPLREAPVQHVCVGRAAIVHPHD